MRAITFVLILINLISCSKERDLDNTEIIFLHHSTGHTVWLGSTSSNLYRVTKKGDTQKFFTDYNKTNDTEYEISELTFPKKEPYGWNNYPFDYYNIWVKNGGDSEYMEEPTLEILTKQYEVIIFKHCFPVSRILDNTGEPNIDSDVKTIENYKLQYEALKEKIHEFPDNKFIIWTPAALTEKNTNEEQALRTQSFYNWMIDEWNEADDNIFIWDFYDLETEGGLYLKEEYAIGPEDSHPNAEFAASLTPLFCQFIIDCIELE